MARRQRRLLYLALVVSWLVHVPAADADVSYVYDDLGRLYRVFDGQGQAATYVYDAVGNILQIQRHLDTDLVPTVTPGPPVTGVAGTNFTFTIRGSFLAGAELAFASPDVQITAVPRATDDEVVVQAMVSPTAAPETLTLTLTTPAGVTTVPVTVVGITSASPTVLPRAASTMVTLTANTDLTGARITTDNSQVAVTQVTTTGNMLTAVFTPALASPIRPLRVTITTVGFTVATTLALSGIDISPTSGTAAASVLATITGTNVDLSGSVVSSASPDVVPTAVEAGPSLITLTLNIAGTASPGPVRIFVATVSGVRHQTVFNVTANLAVAALLGVVQVTPPPGTPAAATNVPITVRVTEPLFAATVSASTVLVTDSAGLAQAGTVALDPDAVTIRFVPAAPFPAATTIITRLTTGVRARSGARFDRVQSFSFTTASQEVFVDAGRGDDVRGDGSSTNPFATIGRGLAAATAGSLVHVATGTYPERLVVPAGVALEGAGPALTIVDGTGAAGQIITVGGGSAVAGVAVHGGDTGIFADRTPLTISAVALTGQAGNGIAVTTPRGVTATGDFVAQGVTVADSGGTAIEFCCDVLGSVTVTGSTLTPLSGFASGVDVCCTIAGPITLVGNTVTGSVLTARGREGLVICCQVGDLIIVGNTITEMPSGDVDICCTLNGPVAISGNTGARGEGIFLCCDAAAPVAFSANTVTGSGFEGIEVCCTFADTFTAVGNTLTDIPNAGLDLCCSFTGEAQIADNTLTSSLGGSFPFGMLLCCDFASTLTIARNTVNSGEGSELCCDYLATVTINDNTLTGGRFDVFDFCCDFHASLVVARNTVSGGVDGVFFCCRQDAGTATVTDNVVRNNERDGIRIGFESAPGTFVLRGNQMTLNGGAGTAISTRSSPTLRANSVTANGGDGVSVSVANPLLPSIGVIDLGTTADPGGNTFQGNGTADPTQFFNLANRGPNPISAIGNRWDHGTAADIDRFDVFDDEEGAAIGQTFGAVQFEPFLPP